MGALLFEYLKRSNRRNSSHVAFPSNLRQDARKEYLNEKARNYFKSELLHNCFHSPFVPEGKQALHKSQQQRNRHRLERLSKF